MNAKLAVALVAAIVALTGCAPAPATVEEPAQVTLTADVRPANPTQDFLDTARSIHARFKTMPAAELVAAGEKLCEGIEKYGLTNYRDFIADNAADEASRTAFDRLIVTASNTLC